MTQRSTPFGNLSKLLITTTTTPPPEEQPSSTPAEARPDTNLATKEPRKEATKPPAAPDDSSPLPSPIPLTPDPPLKPGLTRKQTFEFTKAELEFMAETKFQLRDYGVTKNEIIQTGLELLAKDYRINQKASYFVRKFSARKLDDEFV